MLESRAAADFLQKRGDLPGDVRRALETGATIAYARPWGRTNTIGALGSHWRPQTDDQSALHEELINLRNRLYAHTDDDFNARWVADVSKMIGTSQPFLAPAWRPLKLDALPEIAALAESQKERFLAGAL
jgi:hypothetical protein